MTTFVPAQHIQDFRAAMAKYTPANMFEFVAHLGEMSKMVADFAGGIQAMATKTADELPAAPLVGELLAEISRMARTAGHAAQEVAPAARRAHEMELARQEAPRKNEHMWDIK